MALAPVFGGKTWLRRLKHINVRFLASPLVDELWGIVNPGRATFMHGPADAAWQVRVAAGVTGP